MTSSDDAVRGYRGATPPSGRVPYLVDAWEDRVLTAHPALRAVFDAVVRRCDDLAVRLEAAERQAFDSGAEWDDERYDVEMRRARISGLREYADAARDVISAEEQARWLRLREIGGVVQDHPLQVGDVGGLDVLGVVALWAATETDALPSVQYDQAKDPCTCGFVQTARLPKQLCGRCSLEQARLWLAEERRLLHDVSIDQTYRAEIAATIDRCTARSAELVRAAEHGYGPPMQKVQDEATDELRGAARRHRRTSKAAVSEHWQAFADAVARHYSRELAGRAKRASKAGLGIAHVALLSEWYDDQVRRRVRAMADDDIDAGAGL